MQDLNYTFDAVGNITQQCDDAQQAQYFSNTVIDPTNRYKYDSLYRLVQATGREKGNLPAPNSSGYQPDWIPTNGKSSQSLATYCEQYSYDEVGNILELVHRNTCGGTENWKRSYVYNNNTTNNYLLSAHTGSTPPSSPQFTYDAHGNMLQMPHLLAMNWDFADQMKSSQKTGETTYYVYSGGERIRKIVTDTSGTTEKIKYERIYFGEYEVYHKYNTTAELETERVTHHCNDESLVMLLQEIMTINDGNSIENPITISRYQYGDQLDSAKLELNQNAEVLSYEEYHPFGTTSFEMHTNDSEVSLKRYKYVHKERDSETGLYYYGARYYAAWLGRFTTCDSLAVKLPEWSSYVYTLNNPLKYTDPDGKYPWPILIRSFAPWESFGLLNQYEGDGASRPSGYSTLRSFPKSPESGPRARIHQGFTVNPEMKKISQKRVWSSSSAYSFTSLGREFGSPTGNAVGSNNMDGSYSVSAFYKGSLPLHPGFDIDVHTNFTFKETKGALEITVNQRGDNFPTAETIIYDSSGTGLFIGLAAANGVNPEINVGGDNKIKMMENSLTVLFNEEHEFTGVISINSDGNMQKYTVAQWNEFMTNNSPFYRREFFQKNEN